MRAVARPIFSSILAGALVSIAPAAYGVPPKPAAHHVAPSHRPAHATRRPRFRPPRGEAARDAARLGALVGKECRGKAEMPRNDRETIVMCSNGKTFVVQSPPAGVPATECSLAGTGPQPACFP
jgi:hypothetical protein